MTQVIFGSPSATSFGADDVYISINPPQPIIAGGGATFMGGAPGVARWGPKNSPILCNTPQDLINNFGPPIGSGFDLVQEGSLFLKQGPRGGFMAVRVAHAGDAAATATWLDASAAIGLNLTGLYTGTLGNSIQFILTTGSKDSSGAHFFKVVILCAGFQPEVFDNIPAGTTPALTWTAIAAAINSGLSPSRPASQFVTAAIASSVALPNTSNAAVTFSGGLDGVAVTTADLLGVDGSAGSRTGAFALRNTGVAAIWLVGSTDSTAWTSLQTLAQSENALAVLSFPTGTSIANAIASKITAGIDNAWAVPFKDYITYLDTYLGTNVAVPPACAAAGVICRVNSHESPGNQQVNGIIGTERTLGSNSQPYNNGDLAQMEQAGINTITLPIPAGKVYGVRHGKNSSSNFATSEIAYTTKLNDIIRGLGGSSALGQLVDRPQSSRPGDSLRDQMRTLLNGYFGAMKNPAAGAQPTIDDYGVVCDLSNNSPSSIMAGQCTASVAVKFLAIADKIILNITAGQTVSISVQSTNQSGQPVGQ